MQDDFGRCEKRIRDKRIVLEEKRSSITFVNNCRKRVRRIEVDDCVITEGKRCDYLLVTPEKTEYYVELKGKNVGHGVKQIEATINKLSADKRQRPKLAFVIATRYPLAGTDIQKHQERFKNIYSAKLLFPRPNSEIEL